jgi:EvpB/VC_A0108, tail sheath N-terminal domain
MGRGYISNDRAGDDGFTMDLRPGLISAMLLTGSPLAKTPWEQKLMAWLAEQDMHTLGPMGFDLDEIAWRQSSFSEQKAFLLRVIDDALARDDWSPLTWKLSSMRDWLQSLRQLVEAYRHEFVEDDARAWPWSFDEQTFELCPEHGVHRHVFACPVCLDDPTVMPPVAAARGADSIPDDGRTARPVVDHHRSLSPRMVELRITLDEDGCPEPLAHRLLIVGDFIGKADARPLEDRRAASVTPESMDALQRQWGATEAAADTWRGLRHLSASAPADVEIEIVNCELEDLILDVQDSPGMLKSGLCIAAWDSFSTHPAIHPYAAVVLALDAGATPREAGLLEYLADFATAAHAPVVVGASDALVHDATLLEAWRARSESLWVALCTQTLQLEGCRVHGAFGAALRIAESLARTGTGMAFAPPEAASPAGDRFLSGRELRYASDRAGSFEPTPAFATRLLISRVAHHARAIAYRHGLCATTQEVIDRVNAKLTHLVSHPPGLTTSLRREHREILLNLRLHVQDRAEPIVFEHRIDLPEFADSEPVRYDDASARWRRE